jgi:hypothetical protein
MRSLIFGGGASVLLLLAWAHLGLGALLFAPAATPPRMLSEAGPYVVTLVADSGQFVTGDGNAVSLGVRDRAGRARTRRSGGGRAARVAGQSRQRRPSTCCDG